MTKATQRTDYLVMMSTSGDEKPRAARFNTADEVAVRKAAAAMGLNIGRTSSDLTVKLARKLPQGKIFATGKALVPLVKASLFQELLVGLTIEEACDPSSETDDGSRTTAQFDFGDAPDPWETVKVGTVVLAYEKDNGWWHAVVIALSKDSATLTLRWRDWPEMKKFNSPRHKIGLVRPGV